MLVCLVYSCRLYPNSNLILDFQVVVITDGQEIEIILYPDQYW